jgi:HK97 family phage prohead protease
VKFSGYASVTNVGYDLGSYTETIARGAFRKTLSENPDVVLNIGHGDAASGLPIARTKAGTLRLAEDDIGLKVDADLDGDDPDVAIIARKFARGDLDGQMSFAFRAIRQSWNQDFTQRLITEANIDKGDVSIVVQGASPATSSAMRSLSEKISEIAVTTPERRELARLLGRETVIVERRGFTFDGHHRRINRRSDTCARCDGDGTIDLGRGAIPCPQCAGDGGPSGNAGYDDDAERGAALVREARTFLYRAELEGMARRYGLPKPLPYIKDPVLRARLTLESLRYPPRGRRGTR